MEEREMDDLVRMIRDEYNPPPPAPREEMWAVIQGSLEPRGEVLDDLARARRRRAPWREIGWAAAASVVLALGVGIGRMTAPAPGDPGAVAAAADGAGSPLRLAAVEHLGRSESLLRLVRADGRAGRVDPATGAWARSLLTETRLLLDSEAGDDAAMRALLQDLELVLVQVSAVAEARGDEDRFLSELTLALEGIEQREVLTRLQAVTPSMPGMAGT